MGLQKKRPDTNTAPCEGQCTAPLIDYAKNDQAEVKKVSQPGGDSGGRYSDERLGNAAAAAQQN